MQEQTITLTQYWQRVKAKMEEFLNSHIALPEEHSAKKAARAVIGMAVEGEKLEDMSKASLMWNGLGIKKRMLALATQIGVKNEQTKNHIPVKSIDPAYKDFAKLYLMGLKEFIKVKSSNDLLQQGVPKLGDSGIIGAQKEALEDIAAIEANYPEFREIIAVVESKLVVAEAPHPVLTPLPLSSISSLPPSAANDDSDEFAVLDLREISTRRINQVAQTIKDLDSEINTLEKEVAALDIQIQSLNRLEKALDSLKGIFGFKSLQASRQKKIEKCHEKNRDYSTYLENYTTLLRQKKVLTSLYPAKKEVSINPSALVAYHEEITRDVISNVANKGWDQLENDGSQELATTMIRHALVVTKPPYSIREAVAAVIADKVQKAIYQKTFSKKTGIYLENRGYTSRIFSMISSGETLSQGSLVKAIQKVVANASTSIVLDQSVAHRV